MGLIGRLVAATEFKADGDLFHDLLKKKPQQISDASPDKVQGCDLHEGDFGKVGSIICWRYTHDGKKKTAKQVIQKIEPEKKLMEFKMLGGDLMEKYKSFLVTIHVENKADTELVTWTLEYEMLRDDVEHPISLLSYFIDLTKDIETHYIGK
ncbi:MLP-like protein 34-like [Dorcoceras hygrometricum]|uniref:MLP-like protein 34-like n=1 Tax=Dorcoceras hygrometricum TaxID=472368 RepID=A0A2Z7B6G9_9LAMI|nr:MLP-like protein 34-like [Dorcoceras hygrometricum]